jgi:son of sevenless-like protein
MVISYWLTRRQLPVDSQLLWQMREFCETAIRMKSSSTMVDKAADLLQLIDNRVSVLFSYQVFPLQDAEVCWLA